MSKQKRVKIEGGCLCPKCCRPMQRFKHVDGWEPKTGQWYYFAWWDKCRPCRHLQHYEEAKVIRPREAPAGVLAT